MLTMLLMSTGDAIAIAAISITVLIAVVSFAYRFGKLERRIITVEDAVIKIEKNTENIPIILTRVDILWQDSYSVSESPKRLNEKGEKILKDSKIGEIVNPYIKDITSKLKTQNVSNAYIAQQNIIKEFNKLLNNENVSGLIQKSAFEVGFSADILLYVAALHFRDKIISDLGFEVNDIDIHDPESLSIPTD